MQNTQKSVREDNLTVAGPTAVRHFQRVDSFPEAGQVMSGDERKEALRAARRKVRDSIATVFRYLMTVDDSPRYWTGTMTDLMELTHDIWESERFYDRSGRPLTFRVMARHICRVLHCRVVPNPYTFVEKSRQRKGVTIEPILDRYAHLALDYRLQNPMMMELGYTGSPSRPPQRPPQAPPKGGDVEYI